MLTGTIAFVALGKAIVFSLLGLNQKWWRYFQLPDLWPVVRAAAVTSGLLVAVFTLAKPYPYNLPRSVVVLDFLLTIVLVGGARLARRMIAERPDRATRRRRTRGVLVVGAGSGGQMVVRELRLNPRLGARAIGFVDDDPRKRGMHAVGVKVLGSTDEIGEILDRKAPDEVIIAIPSAPGVLRAKVVAACRERDITVRTLPTVFELLRGGVQLTRQLREVRVEDVLGRDPVVMELERVGAYLEDKIVMVTGAGGSVGAELCRQIARVGPKLLVLLDHAEDNLFRIDREMLDEWHFTRVEAVLADCKEARPDARGDAALQAGRRLPRSRLQARAADGGESARGGAKQRDRHSGHRGNGRGGRRGAVRADLHRQGRQPSDRDGRLEGDGRVDRRGGRTQPRPHPLRDRPLRQRAGVVGQRRADLPRPDREGRPGHRHASRDDPLLHDHSGGGAARDPGG